MSNQITKFNIAKSTYIFYGISAGGENQFKNERIKTERHCLHSLHYVSSLRLDERMNMNYTAYSLYAFGNFILIVKKHTRIGTVNKAAEIIFLIRSNGKLFPKKRMNPFHFYKKIGTFDAFYFLFSLTTYYLRELAYFFLEKMYNSTAAATADVELFIFILMPNCNHYILILRKIFSFRSRRNNFCC